MLMREMRPARAGSESSGIPGLSVCVMGKLHATALDYLPLAGRRRFTDREWLGETNKIIRTAKRSDRLELISSNRRRRPTSPARQPGPHAS
jgi:hypothetical protein